MDKKIRAILNEPTYDIIATVGSAVHLAVAFASSLLLQWAFGSYLTGIAAFIFWITLLTLDLYLVVPPLIKFYGDVRVLWIETNMRIQRAQKKAANERD